MQISQYQVRQWHLELVRHPQARKTPEKIPIFILDRKLGFFDKSYLFVNVLMFWYCNLA